MARELWDIVDAKAVLAMESDDVAGVLMEFFHSVPELDRRRRIMTDAFMIKADLISGFPPQRHEELLVAIQEGWSWLKSNGMIVMQPRYGGCYVFSRRGEQLKNRSVFANVRNRSRFPRELLHEKLVEKSWPHYLRGEFETAVFQAFKEVEVVVRQAGGYGDTDLGTKLMRSAFDPGNGPLTDSAEPTSERESLGHLFAGAIGRFKNPSSHRHVVLTDPTVAFEMLVIASHLLRVVDDRTSELADHAEA